MIFNTSIAKAGPWFYQQFLTFFTDLVKISGALFTGTPDASGFKHHGAAVMLGGGSGSSRPCAEQKKTPSGRMRSFYWSE